MLTVVAAQLGLLEEDAPGSSLTLMLQSLNRFLLERIIQDFRSLPPHSTQLEEVSLLP
jgi:PAB-dependent poly(A)-specific ribonuclease subunit 2